MTPQEKFQQQLAALMTKPSFLTEQLLLEINEEFCRIMDEQGISRSELAERIGVKRQFITRILNGNPNITLLTLVKIATALNAKLGFELTVIQKAEQKDLPLLEAKQQAEQALVEPPKKRKRRPMLTKAETEVEEKKVNAMGSE